MIAALRLAFQFILINIFVFTVATHAARAQTPWPAVSPTVVPTVEYALPYAGILPDHPLYFLKALRDKILIFITRDPLKKSQLYLLLSDKSLVMSSLLFEKGSYELSNKTLVTGEKYLLQSVMVLHEVTNKDQEIPPGVVDKLELAAKKHDEIITRDLPEIKEAVSITHQAIQKITTLKSL